MRTLLILAIALIPAVAQAQVVQVQQRIGCNLGRCKVGIGSGVAIGWEPTQAGCRKYYVLTVAHNAGVQERHRFDPRLNYGMSVATRSGLHQAKIEQCDGARFLMLLSFVETSGEKIPVLPIANRIAQAGESVTISGFSQSRQGQFSVRSLSLRSTGPQCFTVTSPFEQGESGGPVCDQRGEIIGLCEGYNSETKIGFGPSAAAIRAFLNLPAIGSVSESRESKQLPVQPGLPVQPSRPEVPVREPIADAPPFNRAPVYNPGPVVPHPPPEPVDRAPVVPAPEHRAKPDPVKVEDTPAIPRIPPATPKEPVQLAGDKPQGGGAGAASSDPESAQSSVGSKVVTAARFGLDLWSVLAGVGLVAGTGGIGGLALLGWRGFKAARTLKQLRQGLGGPSTAAPSPVSQQVKEVINTLPPIASPVTTPVSAPQPIRLPLQSTNFVEVPVDYRRESVDYALAETGRKYPGAIATLEVVKSLINQHLQANGHGPESLHS